MAPLTLYQTSMSAPCRAVLLTIRNLHLEVNLHELNYAEGEHLKKFFTSINPQHTFPTLVDNGFAIWESRAIMQYLAETNSNNKLISKIPKKNALIQQHLYFDLGTVVPRLYEAMIPLWTGASTVIDPEEKTRIYNVLGQLDSFLEQSEWFVGDCVTIADLSSLATVSTFVAIGADISRFNNLSAWYARCQQLPGFDENEAGANQIGDLVKSKMTEPF